MYKWEIIFIMRAMYNVCICMPVYLYKKYEKCRIFKYTMLDMIVTIKKKNPCRRKKKIRRPLNLLLLLPFGSFSPPLLHTVL
ncbi:hypothetical protein BCR42DRAFT_419025, partial [Absidia repens]